MENQASSIQLLYESMRANAVRNGARMELSTRNQSILANSNYILK